jgi:hypothetical protein
MLAAGVSAGALLFGAGHLATSGTPEERVVNITPRQAADSSAGGASRDANDVAAEAPNPVVANTQCSKTVAWNFESAALSSKNRRSAVFVNSRRDLSGPVAALTVFNEAPDIASQTSADTQQDVHAYEDGTALVAWTDKGRMLGTLSSKRIPRDELTELANAVMRGSDSYGDFIRVPTPQASAVVRGSSCHVGEQFLGLEVVIGDFAQQLDYAIDTDPTGTEVHDGYVVLQFNRVDPSQAVPYRSEDRVRWTQFVAESQAKEDTP